jgi:hypothetical protein
MKQIDKIREHLNIVWHISEQLSVKRNGNNEFVSSMFFVSVSHCDAVQLLAKNKNLTSAFALLRPTLENSFRAAWLFRCADEEEAKKAIKKSKWPSVGQAIEEIENESIQTKLFSMLWGKLKTFANDFTHGGSQLAGKHMKNDGFISPNFSEKEISVLLDVSVLISTYILGELIELSNETEKVLPLYKKLVDETNEWFFS